MNGCAKLLGFLVLFFAAVVIFPIIACGYSAVRIFSDQQTYSQLFSSPDLFKFALPALVDVAVTQKPIVSQSEDGASVTVGASGGASTGFDQNIEQATYDKIPSDLPVLVWLQSTVNTKIGDFFGWINGNKNSFDLSIDLKGLKSWLANSASVSSLLSTLVDGLPACITSEETALQKALAQEVPNLSKVVACKPKSADLQTNYIKEMTNLLVSYNTKLPDSVTLDASSNSAFNMRTTSGQSVTIDPAQPFPAPLNFTGVGLSLFFCPGILVLFGVAMAARTGKGWFGWAGAALLASGAILALFAFPLTQGSIFDSAGLNLLVSEKSSLVASRVVNHTLGALFGRFGSDMLSTAGVIALMGVILLAVAVILPRARGPMDDQKRKNDDVFMGGPRPY